MKLIVKSLLALGYADVWQAWDGQEAVDRITLQGENFQIIFMDNIMPLLTGPQACKIILAHYEEINAKAQQEAAAAAAKEATEGAASTAPLKLIVTPPVIIALTASCMSEDRTHAAVAGHSDFLAKPLSLPILKQKLQHWAAHIHAKTPARTCAEAVTAIQA